MVDEYYGDTSIRPVNTAGYGEIFAGAIKYWMEKHDIPTRSPYEAAEVSRRSFGSEQSDGAETAQERAKEIVDVSRSRF